jgi:hypothetical protein
MFQAKQCINDMNDAHAYDMQVQMWKLNTWVVTYSRYCYLYFTTKKHWSKDLLSNKSVSISQHTSIARARDKVAEES